eukprot:TRINITY_DN2516_c0_g1_i1.p1 TRINITY_DN2516_c0_g1~~TRINITY_DN2516_c0_g1_i1.p1  ORF type:complete len:540 (+),score=117.93 TRINITY_DN2516_c0_g1_i1:250-1869(+)
MQQQAEEEQQFNGVSGFHQFLVEGNHGLFAALNNNGNHSQFLHQIVQQSCFEGRTDHDATHHSCTLLHNNDSTPHNAVDAQEEEEREAGRDGCVSAAAAAAAVTATGGGGNRWPREETVALLRIRSAMESSFRDNSIKGPLWENVSRKLAELGYHRSAKKCKEKFENINKYYRKTKEGKKSYKFCSELEALFGAQKQPRQGLLSEPINNASTSEETHKNTEPVSETQSTKNKKKKRKRLASISAFFQNLVNQVISHQEELHRKFLEAMDRRDQERLRREEAWKRQEMARLAQETELRAQEQAVAFTREETIVALLQKIAEKTNITDIHNQKTTIENKNSESNDVNWTDTEVQSVIRLRSSMDERFQENGNTAHLWEELASKMVSLGFHKSANSCREKWESLSSNNFNENKDHSKPCFEARLDEREDHQPVTDSHFFSKTQPVTSGNCGAFQNPYFQGQKRPKVISARNEGGDAGSSKRASVLDKQVKDMLENLHQNDAFQNAEAPTQNSIDESQHQSSPFTLMALVQKLSANNPDYAAH